jgi:hypothetical protein
VKKELLGGISRKFLAETLPLNQAMDRKIIVLIFAMGKNPLTHWRHYDVIRDQIFLILP